MSSGPWGFDLTEGLGYTKTQSALANIITGSALTKTQSAIARISGARTKTQTAVSNIALATSGPWGFDLSESQTVSKTQSAIANIIAGSANTKTQSAVARISVARTKTQSAVSSIALPGSGPWGFDLTENTVSTKTQTAIAKIQISSNKTQSATANISDWYVVTSLPANSQSYNDYSVTHGSTYEYRVVPVTSGVDGDYIYSDNTLYNGGTITTKTQSAVAKIAIRATNNLMMGYNF